MLKHKLIQDIAILKICMKLYQNQSIYESRGWSGGAMVLGKLPVPGRPTLWMIVGQGPTALAVGAGGGCLDIFDLIYPFSSLSPSLYETARYRLKYCLKRPLHPKQPTKPNISKQNSANNSFLKIVTLPLTLSVES